MNNLSKPIAVPIQSRLKRSLVGLAAIVASLRRNLLSFDNTAQASIDLTTPIKTGRYFEITGCFVPEVLEWRSIFGGVDFNARLNGTGQFELLYANTSNAAATCKTIGAAKLGEVNTFSVNGTPDGVTVKLNDETISNTNPIKESLAMGRLGRSDDTGTVTTAGSTSLDGSIFDIKMWVNGNRTTGDLVLDMPLHQSFSGLTRYVDNKTSVFGQNISEAPLTNPLWETQGAGSITDISEKSFTLSGAGSGLKIRNALTAGKTYIIEMSGFNSNLQLWLGLAGSSEHKFNENRSYVVTANAGELDIYLRGIASGECSFSSLSIREIPNENPVGIAYNMVADDIESFEESENELSYSESLPLLAGSQSAIDNGDGTYSYDPASGMAWVQAYNMDVGAIASGSLVEISFDYDLQIPNGEVVYLKGRVGNSLTETLTLSESTTGTFTGQAVADGNGGVRAVIEGIDDFANTAVTFSNLRYRRILDNVSYPAPLAERYFTTFDDTAQTYIQLSEVIALDADFEIEFNSQIPEYGGYFLANNLSGSGDNRICITSAGGIYGFGFVDDQTFSSLLKASVLYRWVLKRVGSTVTLTADGLTATASSSAELSLNSFGAQYGNTTSISYMSGAMSDFKIWTGGDRDTGTLVLDMPIDEPELSNNHYVSNKIVTLGADVFAPARITGSWVDNGDGSYYKNAATGGDLGEYHIDSSAIPAGETVLVNFTVDAESDGINVFTRDGGVNVAIETTLGTGTYSMILTAGDGGGIWFARTNFIGTISNISIQVIPANSICGMAYNFVPADTEHFIEDETFGWVGDDQTPSTPISIGSYWTDNGDGSYTIDAPDGAFNSLFRARTEIGSFYFVKTEATLPVGNDTLAIHSGTPNIETVSEGTTSGKFQSSSSSFPSFARRSGNSAGFSQTLLSVSIRKIIQVN